MAETPIILSHNVLKGAKITCDSAAGYPAWRIADGLRWTWWEGVSVGNHDILVMVPNLITNGDFELNADGWFSILIGSAAGTFSRNTTNPIDGAADGHLVVGVADNSTNLFYESTIKPFSLKAGRTYRFSSVVKAGAALDLVIGFMSASLNVDSFLEVNANTGAQEVYLDFTPTVGGEYRVFYQPLEAGDFFVDDVHLCEVRDVDTLFLDQGHNLIGYNMELKCANTAYSNAAFNSVLSSSYVITDKSYFSLCAHPARGVQWKISIMDIEVCPLSIPRISLAWIGRRWTLPRNFSGAFDPHASRTFSQIVSGERKIETRTYQASSRFMSGTLRNLSPFEYEEIIKFMDDTEDAVLPFVFIWRPISNPGDVLLMRLDKEERNVPCRGGYFRDWPFNAVEVCGKKY